jgi:site-specific DNA-methyltransferase (adenine-specific)
MVSLLLGDCLEKMKEMRSNSVDSIITDPPYGISFMNKKWDYDIPSITIWKECFRVLKPGGHLLSFGGSRTFHRIAVNIEDAGFDIRETIMYLYGSGFPKSHNIGKAVDKKLGNEREVVGVNPNHRTSDALYELGFQGGKSDGVMTKGTSEWEGWGTGLKPAHEPIIMARKPFRGTVVSNVLEYGTGAINIDECRIPCDDKTKFPVGDYSTDTTVGKIRSNIRTEDANIDGRFPANVIHDGSEEVVSLFPNTKSGKMTSNHNRHTDGSPNGIYGKFDVNHPLSETYGDEGSAARFFYCAKASKKDRGEGNTHPTVKPTELMKYLCKLITPKNGVILDPFMGSGSTGKAALLEGFSFIGIEMDEEYLNIASARLSHVCARISHVLGDKNEE